MKSVLSSFAGALLVTLLASPAMAAIGPQARILIPIDNANRTTLAGSRPPLANATTDAGPLPDATPLQGISLIFNRTAAQQADLDSLLIDLQNPASPLFHQWLNPDQFAARFGTAASDIDQATAWLQQQGFTVTSVSRSRDRIFFSGTAGQVASAFGAPLHNFTAPNGQLHYAPSADLTLPAALAPSVLGIGNLSSFRPHNNLKRTSSLNPEFTSGVSGSHFIGPKDLATIYDVNAAYSAGYTGVNQSIVIIGQSFVYQTDIKNFQTAAGVTQAKAPILVLVPSSGASYISTGDEGESDLDLEYSSTMAPGAQVYFVYTGSSTNYNVFNALQYAVDEKLAPIISSSYGACEPQLGSSNFTQLNNILAQAAAQGQTVLSAAGDAGSTDCSGSYTAGSASNYQLAADFPASSQYVTAMGGSEFPTASTASTNSTYWTNTPNTDVISSAKSYIPEQVWNDDVAAYNGAIAVNQTPGLSSGGGGVSLFAPRPTWQTGVTIGGVAIPAGSYRLLPDISLDAANYSAPLLYCGVDQQAGSCGNGFRDLSDTGLTVAGGTSFDGPIFSGMLALILQRLNSTGLGVINSTLYSLASNTATYASAFHDITVGGNQCLSPSTTLCGTSGAQLTSYAAGVGYDQASGLGSIDLYNLLTAWPTTTASSLATTITTLGAATSTPIASANDSVTITVTPATTNVKVPTGTLALTIDGGATYGGSTTTLTLVNGAATYTFNSSVGGSHIITAVYSGDNTTFGPSTADLVLTVTSAASGGSFTLTSSPATLPITQGNSSTDTITATPVNGYTGTIQYNLTYPASLTNACASGSNTVISGTGAQSMVITIYTSLTTCNSLGLQAFSRPGAGNTNSIRLVPAAAVLRSSGIRNGGDSPWRKAPLPVAFAGLAVLFGLRRRSRLLRSALALGVLAVVSFSGLGLTGCGGGGTVSPAVATANDTAKGSYVLTLIGTDSLNPALTSSTSVTLVVQ